MGFHVSLGECMLRVRKNLSPLATQALGVWELSRTPQVPNNPNRA